MYLKRGGGSDYPPRIACYVCGAEGPADYPLFMSPHGTTVDHKLLPHFPFLRELVPPLGLHPPSPESTASSCRTCYISLMKQWDDNEKGGVPLESRVYWTKRVAHLPVLLPEQQMAINRTEMSRYPGLVKEVYPPAAGKQSKLWGHHALPADNLWKKMGPPSTTPLLSLDQNHPPEDNDSALDLSSGSRDRETMKSRSSVISHLSHTSHHSSYQSEGAGSSTDILDLTLPDKNAATEVCYVCGDDYKKGAMAYLLTRPSGKRPHFPSLVFHPRPPRSRPLDSAGRVQCCEECVVYLTKQWDQFEEEKVLHPDRNFTLRKRQTQVFDSATFVCYICALDYHSSYLRLLYCRSNSENEPYYPQIEQNKPPPGASPISSGGMVQVCSHCYKCTREKHQSVKTPSFEPPLKKRKSSRASVEILTDPDQGEEDDKSSPADIQCVLCHRKFTVHSFKFLHTAGPPLGGTPFFPFLKTLPRLNEDVGFAADEDSQGRVRACQTCTTSLINQWTTHQREALPIDDRSYSYLSLTGPQSSGRGTPGETLRVTPTSGRSVHSPGGGPVASPGQASSKIINESVRPRSNSNNAANYGDNPLKVVVSEPMQRLRTNVETRSNPHSPRGPPPASHSPISVHSGASVEPCHKPSTSSFYCFLCGLHSELSFARMLYSRPQGKKAPFFPFMADHTPKPRAETMREDGTALVCTFCYHSVMVQWTRFHESKSPVPVAARQYNINDFVCYVCGIKTYRKRIRALRVVNLLARCSSQASGHQDFPFLRNHRGAKGTLTMENGEMAAVCQDCFETLKSQFAEAAKYGIPVEKRQYNWMQIPPPREDEANHIVTPKERLDKMVSQC